jgi:hypothetical protein
MANGAVIAIVIIIVILLLVGLGVLIYYLTRKKKPTGPTGSTGPIATNPVTNSPVNGDTGNIPPVNFTPPPPSSMGPTGPTCPNGPGGEAPEGCMFCSTPGIFLCPVSVISQAGPYGQNSQISCFRVPQYDPPTPPITLSGKGYFFREYNNSCPP